MTKIFSGIRPSGKLHLGNYLGAIKNWVGLQDKTEQTIFAVVDYHAITTPYDPKTYGQQITDVILDYLAAGVDPERSLLIRQSKIPAHTELAWIFNTVTPVSWLDRLPTYKEQLEKTKNNNMGLLAYPVLMAADILIYKSNLVPVGEDQLPHIDVTNEIAKKFNHMFGQTFEIVRPHLEEGARIMSLQDPTKKMSKTPQSGKAAAGQAGDEACIFLVDSPDNIAEKIKKAITDSGKEIKYDEKKKPAISNLITIYHLLSPVPSASGGATGQAGKSIQEIEDMYKGKSYVDFKNDLTEIIIGFLGPFQEKRNQLKNNPDYVISVLTKSEEKARNIANSTLTEVKRKIGVEQ